MNTKPLIALLTDFGLSDAYVGTMKGVILSICPAAHLIDLTHTIPPQNVRQAAYVLLTTFRYFPASTVFLVVVDPGVGTSRQPIAVETDHGIYVAPDNGVLSYVLPHVAVRRSVVLQHPAYRLPDVSSTFHGRDIFSPAAAHLANGVPVAELGSILPDLQRLPDPVLAVKGGEVHGEVLHIDHFGNIVSSIGRLTWTGPGMLRLEPRFGSDRAVVLDLDVTACRVTIGAQTLDGVQATYGDVPPRALTALVGSSGQLEIGKNQGSAAQALGASAGDAVALIMNT
ncbi:MAG: SAM-dependent chlorinase/fluorinase [Anaerolineae bacterium]|nr:SAM-dependent chlorinase/fluorinase [Anaerolineae bacterium]